MRTGCLGLLLALSVGCSRPAPDDGPDRVTGPADADYATARQAFRTTLTRKGPSPQEGAMPRAVAGAVPMAYESGGLKLTAWVNPDAARPGPKRPAVLVLHGGFSFAAEDWEYGRAFLMNGFHVMMPVLRGENGQPGDYTMFYDEVDDVLAAADALARLDAVDPQRLYVAGHSAGGTLALLAALTTDRFKACASLSGSPNQRQFLIGQEGLAAFDPRDEAELRMRSPLTFAAHFKCPVRAYHGDSGGDEAFAPATAEMARRAKDAGKDVEAVAVKGDHFTMVAPANRKAVEFFRENGGK